MKNTHLFVIDPQNDFTEENGALYVPGANPDMTRFLLPFTTMFL